VPDHHWPDRSRSLLQTSIAIRFWAIAVAVVIHGADPSRTVIGTILLRLVILTTETSDAFFLDNLPVVLEGGGAVDEMGASPSKSSAGDG